MISKLWYVLTAYVPRRLPTTPEEYDHFKCVMMDCYGVVNEPPYWALIAGQICSTPAHKLRKAWGDIANAAKRIDINNLAQKDRKFALEALNKKLEKATDKHSKHLTALNKIIEDYPSSAEGALSGNPTCKSVLIKALREALKEEASDDEYWKFIVSVLVDKHVKKLRGDSNEQASQKQPETNAGPQSPSNQELAGGPEEDSPEEADEFRVGHTS